MPRFKYELQKDGKVVTGKVDAPNAVEASNQARKNGGYLSFVEEIQGGEDFLSKVRNFRLESKPGLKDVLYLTKQLEVMVRAGISVRDAIGSIAENVGNQRFRKILDQMRRDVESGCQFSEALAKHQKIFGELYVNMIRASEMSGTFAHMLNRIAQYLEQQAETRSMVRGAMIYPGVLFTVSIGAVIFLLTWVLPRFVKVFAGKEDRLPKPTKMLLALSDFLRYDWYFCVGGAVVAIAAILLTLHTERGRLWFDHLKLHVPVFRKLFRAVSISRSLQTMGELINAGVPMLETLEITADVSGNLIYKDMWLDVRDAVKEGDKLVTMLRQRELLPRSVVQMISAGEESGRLGEVLMDVSGFYSRELKETIKAVTGLLEPVMIVFMGFVVGFIAMSIMLPVFTMSKVASEG